mmetsp:Transcript_12742/g.25331  ORF Transcript_12742/g.25331 Transcript_12742/m.25331 type:complete len:937 (+) Transcript_12742:258-3068(+)
MKDEVVAGNKTKDGDNIVMTYHVCGVPFTAIAKNLKDCKRLCIEQAIRVFQSVAPCNAVDATKDILFPRNAVELGCGAITVETDVKSVVQRMWTLAKTYKMNLETVAQRCNELLLASNADKSSIAEEEASSLLTCRKTLVLAANELFPLPSCLMKLLGVSTFRFHDLVDCAAQLLSRRAKKIEIGSALRMKVTYHKNRIMALSNSQYGSFLVSVGPLKDAKTLDEMLDIFDARLTDIVDEIGFMTSTEAELTTEALYNAVTTANQRSRNSRIFGCRIGSVLWPMQSVAEFYETMSVLEQHLAKQISKDCMTRLKKQIQGETVTKTLGIHMNVNTDAENWSSMVIATEMNLTEIQYAAKVEDCHSHRVALQERGHAWMSLDPTDCEQMRQIVVYWKQFIDEQLLIAPASTLHRNIGSWVDEYAMFPGGESQVRNSTLKLFLERLCGIKFTEMEVLKLLTVKPLKGLSPIAKTEAGKCFRDMELLLVISAEIRTKHRSLTVSSHTALGAHVGTRPQPPHLDDQRPQTLVGAIPLNQPHEGPFKATLVPDLQLDFKRLYEDQTKNLGKNSFSEIFMECYRPLIDLPPDRFIEAMQPAVGFFQNTGMLVILGNELHCGPGNTHVSTSKGDEVRLVQFVASGIEGSHYDGKQQMMWDQMIEQAHGVLSFWCLLHITEFALCDGIHVSGHYDEVRMPIYTNTWNKAKVNPWSRSKFLDQFILMCRYLCSPRNLGLAEWPLIGQPTRRRKRALTKKEPKYEYGKLKYNRLQVRKAVTVLWEFLTVAPEHAERVLKTFFDMIGVDISLEGWAATAEMRALRQVFQMVHVTPVGQSGYRGGHGVKQIRNEMKSGISPSTWATMTAETETLVDPVPSEVDVKIANAKKLGFLPNEFVLFKTGKYQRGIVRGYDYRGLVEVTVALPDSIEVVVDVSELTLVTSLPVQ